MDDQTQNQAEDNKIKADEVKLESEKDAKAETKKENTEEDFKSKYLRALADYKNLEKRMQEERVAMFGVITASVLQEFLPILDMMNQAEVFVNDKGLTMVKNQLAKTLKDAGLIEVELLNKPFDPHTAECIEIIDGDKDNVVVEVLKNAYSIAGKIVRPGQVKVSRVSGN